jgi:beta-mannanase
MDDESGRYPWANRDAATFRYVFAHVAIRCRSLAPNVRMAWSVKGSSEDPGKYYPGNGAVDIVGITVFSVEDQDVELHGRVIPFREKVEQQVRKIAGIDRPILVAEAGVSGSPAYRLNWLKQAVQHHPDLLGVIYFNAIEPWAWPRYGNPDWTIPQDVLSGILQEPASR